MAIQHELWRRQAQEMFRSLKVRQARYRGKELGLPPALAEILEELVNEETGIAPLLDAVRESESISVKALRYWLGILCVASHSSDDAVALFAVLQDERLVSAHSAAKKAMLGLDFQQFGPPIA